ncbi:MAG TPA: NAD-dependent succinate-semialdehyde dehydrogenase [Gemmatimonadales bacterium]|nr:NAD-dependent succinate-semialdehyde dehydrogenase [Gemmatimonadales bacterium]HPF61128.1 NAD-dependent succinate-semialdehyde dehydrogenase [Gemmatimonadales bacterium]HRX18758.1 NAD-dependent succinate-semialdehyde dehydrogenase [Gemmatimonadales bacterium]
MPHVAINPTTGETIARHEELSAAELRRAIAETRRAWVGWQAVPFAARGELLRGAARVLRSRSTMLAQLMAREMGKPVREGRSEVEKCAWVCEYYAEHGDLFLDPEVVATDAGRSYVAYRPLGIVFAVMPWNFPFWQVFRFAAPVLMGGNAGLLKHAANVPGCALAIEDVFRDAGFPAGLFRTLLISHQQSKAVIRNRAVAAVTLTGSTRAGKAIAKEAGAQLKKCVLELGGSDPYLILEDADLDLAVEACATSRLINSGQSCIAAKRFLVVPSVREAFERKLVDRMRRAVVGDPLLEETTVGPQARVDLRDDLHAQVEASVAKGARLLLGGTVPPGPGAFYPPTVLTDVKRGMPAYSEELFGPVAAIIPVKDEAAAIKVANDSIYGLGAAVFTTDAARGERIAADRLEAGSCFVNAFVKSDPRLPFGGIKQSGFGRELARHGLLEFQNAKTVYVK